MIERFRALRVVDWIMRYSPARRSFAMAHVCVVVLLVIVAFYVYVKGLVGSGSLSDLMFYSPFIAAVSPYVLMCIPMHDEKIWERRVITCAMSIGLSLVAACAAMYLGMLFIMSRTSF
jgi:hypothetical protein